MVKQEPSRSDNSPIVWSSSASVKITPARGVCLIPGPGCNLANDSICRCTSGPALMRYQSVSLSLTAREDCNNGLSASFPSRTLRQLEQAQFHCGKPPPAAVPKTLIRICLQSFRLLVVHRYYPSPAVFPITFQLATQSQYWSDP